MVKFIEVVDGPSEYDPIIEACKPNYFLEEVYINPDYIISMKENVLLRKKSSVKALVNGMNEDLFFTELTVHKSHRCPKLINVVGHPTILNAQCYNGK